ncbi:hypothetical protein B0H16DRAFT_1580449 [Mycena metata]|uniref:Uncharacterized protein n=1 Tax=Mycena metata TaxID=1033252 RepID=A0AAD7I1B1_9AGAR|nr:hypothetical protein B0H16DRAFT_1580449 [Mycena metata]
MSYPTTFACEGWRRWRLWSLCVCVWPAMLFWNGGVVMFLADGGISAGGERWTWSRRRRLPFCALATPSRANCPSTFLHC